VAKTLLAIDDSVTMRKVFEITFGGEDFTVVTADGKDSGLAKLSENPAVVLVDTSLGNDDGYALAKEIRKKSPSAAVIILASKGNPYDAAKGKEAGADDFADKPFDTQQLIDKVKKALAAREAGGPVAAVEQEATAKPAPVAEKAPAAAASPVSKSTQPSVADKAPASAPLKGTLVSEGKSGPDAKTKEVSAAARAASAAAPAAAAAAMGAKLDGLGLSKEQIEGVTAISREIIEQVVWEVVPQLAEALIKEEIERLMRA